MGKKNKKSNALRRQLLARNEADNRRSILETYTQPIHPGDNLVEYKAFLAKFYRNIYQHKAEIKRVLREPMMKQFHDQLVPHQVSYEDFWQRYFYRCDKRCIDRWEQTNETTNVRRSSAYELLNDVSNRSGGGGGGRNRSTSSMDGEEDDEPSVTTTTTKESVAVAQEKAVVATASAKEETIDAEEAKDDASDTTSPPLVEESEISEYYGSNNSAAADTSRKKLIETEKQRDPPPGSTQQQQQQQDWGSSIPLFWKVLAGIAALGGVLTTMNPLMDKQGKFTTSVCDNLRGGEDALVPGGSSSSWKHQLHKAICPPPEVIELALEEDDTTDSSKKQAAKPWSAITDKIRWRRRRTQNYVIDNNDVVLKEEPVEIDDESSLQDDAEVPSSAFWWPSSWNSDTTEQLALAAAGNDDASSSSSVASSSSSLSFMDRIRRRGWKSKSWGETDQGDLVMEEQHVSVTMEGIQTTSSSNTATNKATISPKGGISVSQQPAPRAFTKTVITEVKKTTIYTPVD